MIEGWRTGPHEPRVPRGARGPRRGRREATCARPRLTAASAEPPRPDQADARGGGGVPRDRAGHERRHATGRDGWPHLTALWYVMRGTDPWVWTYREVAEGQEPGARRPRDDAGRVRHRVRGAEGRDAEDARAHRARHRADARLRRGAVRQVPGHRPGQPRACAMRCAPRPPSAWRSASRSSRPSAGTTPSSAASTSEPPRGPPAPRAPRGSRARRSRRRRDARRSPRGRGPRPRRSAAARSGPRAAGRRASRRGRCGRR